MKRPAMASRQVADVEITLNPELLQSAFMFLAIFQ